MKSSYYYGRHPKPISLETIKTKASVRQIFNDSKQSAGARSIVTILMNEHNIKLTRYVAGKLKAQMGLKSCQLKTHKYKHADEAHKMHHNILNRNFSPAAPNQVWTGDVNYIHIKGGWCYLAVVLDLYARLVVGFAVSDSPDSVLTTKALQMAYQTRLQPIGVLFYSDQGTHYTSKTFAESVASCEGMTQSMTRKGNSLRAQPSALHSGKAVLC